MAVTSELNTNPGLCAFVCLYPRNLDEMGFLEESIKKTINRDEISFDYFFTERQEIVGIVHFSVQYQLERLLERVRRFCERTEFHLILDGIASITNIDPESACAPCIYPNKANLDRRPDMDCSHCTRYSRRPNDGGVLKVRVDLPLGENESASWGRSISDY
jgi:hypothetical protein